MATERLRRPDRAWSVRSFSYIFNPHDARLFLRDGGARAADRSRCGATCSATMPAIDVPDLANFRELDALRAANVRRDLTP